MPTEGVFDDQLYDANTMFKDDDKLIVGFYLKAVKNNFKSTLEGRPVFDEVEFIKIITPGSRDVLDTKVTPTYQARFSARYAAWKAKHDNEAVSGTFLSEVPWISLSLAAELNAMNVKTVEQLIAMPDIHGQKIMGFSQLKARCVRFMEAAAGEAPSLKLEAENEKLKSTVEQQARQIKEMQEAIKNLQKDKAKV